MSDDPTKTGLDRKLIGLDDPDEIRHWCASFACSEPELREAMQTVGRSAAKVREYLESQR